ncbi:hypothetical protein [Rouxiella sp. Mn2063]|uniref:hypothetical protein n=1 Tax=Rouxiella sp. Mn2063 TaxID=3395262 RepID=UPI003BD40628
MKELLNDEIEQVSGAGIIGLVSDIKSAIHSGGVLIQDAGVTAKSAISVLGSIKNGSFSDLPANVFGTVGGVIDMVVDVAHIGSDAFSAALNLNPMP